MMDYEKKAIAEHRRLHGKISVCIKEPLDTKEKLSIYYTPGVGAVSSLLAKSPDETRDLTWTNNNLAVISDGSAVLGLGNIGPLAALPVMEGKAMIFKNFANIDAVPIVLDVHTADEIVDAVKAIAPSFGAINLEDIAAPICFEVEDRLKKDLSIPVMHDDQHGTAIVVLAGLINAVKVADKKLDECRIVIVGAGAAGTAVIKLLRQYSKADILAVDSRGIISSSRTDLNKEKKELLKFTNNHDENGSLEDSLVNSDIFIGVSRPGLLSEAMVKIMSKDPIIIAMANPVPEIMPELAIKAGAKVVATGRSDLPNQINNSLAFPGVFRGALDHKVSEITDKHKIAAAEAIASLVKEPSTTNIIPGQLDKRLVPTIAKLIV